MEIFNGFGSILGYILYFLFMIVQNYGVAILIFTILLRAAMFPLNIKQQKTQAKMAHLQAQQKILQERYKNNREKYQEEVQKLYDREGARPGGGCLTALIPFPIMLGLYYAIISPLSNMLHLSQMTIQSATMTLNQIPGISATFSSRFTELEIVKNFDVLKPYLDNVWTADQIADVDRFAHSFNFLGLDLLQTPLGGAWYMWIIPVLCLVLSVGTQVYQMFTNDAMKSQQGCMKVTMLLLPLLTAYLALTMPGAIGMYWVISNAATFVQIFVSNKFFSKEHMLANQEARRVARRVQEEKKVREIPMAERRVITKENIRNQGTVENQRNAGQKTNKKKK